MKDSQHKTPVVANPARIVILKRPDDPQGITRVSAGAQGNDKIYCVYRGRRENAIRAMQAAARALASLREEPEITPDDEEQRYD